MSDDSDSLLKIGGKFGDYDVIKLLGKGGMGEVYLLRSPTNGEFYAAKIMFPPKDCDAHEWRSRFANEASIAMKIRHSNLIRVYDVGEDPDTSLCYILMEYLSGGCLSDRLRKKGRLSIRESVSITLQIAMALEVSHRAGIVHRDIKPDNIMFADDGTPKLVDLGVAKLDDGRRTMVTMTGMIIGTPAYMAPEQMLDSHNVDARADIYSLGVVLYEMLSGSRPNEGSTTMELLAKAIKGEELPDVRKMRPEVSATISYVISRMTAPKAISRVDSAMEAAKMLRDAFTGDLKSPLKLKRPKDIKLSTVTKFAKKAFIAAALLFELLFMGFVICKSDMFEMIRMSNSDKTENNGNTLAPATKKVFAKAVDKRQTIAASQNTANTNDGLKWHFRETTGGLVIEREKENSKFKGFITDPAPKGAITIPQYINGRRVVEVGDGAFMYCGEMTSLTIPEGVTNLSNYALWFCKKLERLEIPASLSKYGPIQFKECRSLEQVRVAPGNKHFISYNNALYSHDWKKLYAYPKTATNLNIVVGTKVIVDTALSFCSFQTAKIPEGVESCGSWAFEYCPNLEEVVFPKSLKATYSAPLQFCNKLKKVVFLGDAPRTLNMFVNTPEDLVIEVRRGTKGWKSPGSTSLPERWPANGESRRIRYINEESAR